MLAVMRPDDWDLPLFLHVLGAIVLVGGTASMLTLSAASLSRGPEQAALLRRLVFGTALAVVWPGFVLMRVAAQWVLDKEGLDENTPGWADVGLFVSDIGVLVLALLTIFAWVAYRRTRPDGGRPAAAPIVTGLCGLYLLALGVALYAMTAKPG